MNTDAFAVRSATPEDLDAVARLAAQLIRLHHEWDPDRFMLPGDPESGYRWWLAREIENKDVELLVAVDSGARVVGYAYARMEERDWAALREPCGMLHDIFVDESVRRHGVASLLLRDVLDRLARRGSPRVVLHTAFRNTAAQALFRRAGFRETMIEMTRENDSPDGR